MFLAENMTYVCVHNQLILYNSRRACINACEYNEKN